MQKYVLKINTYIYGQASSTWKMFIKKITLFLFLNFYYKLLHSAGTPTHFFDKCNKHLGN